MGREEALEELKEIRFNLNYKVNGTSRFDEALNMAIEALEQEHCDDAISRQELLKAISTWDKFGCDADTKLVPYKDHYVPYIHYDDVINCIKDMPSVTPQPKMGRWITWKEADNIILSETRFECSVCHDAAYTLCNGLDLLSDYCPNCGAYMREVEK